MVFAKGGEDFLIIDVRGICSYTDYIMLASARSTRQAKAIAEHVLEESEKKGIKLLGAEGLEHGNWVLLDYNDIVIHIFYKPVREYYELEGLWADAKMTWVSDEKELKRFLPAKRRVARKRA